MAARTRKGTKLSPWTENVKERIRASMLANALQNHVLGRRKMANSQVKAAQILLAKVLPDLMSTKNETEVTHRYVARAPAVSATDEAWQEQHAPTTH